MPRNDWQGKAIHRLDMRLQKHVRLGGRASVDGMLEVFNVFNHANYGVHDAGNQRVVRSAGFQRNVSYQPRGVQLGFRLQF